MDWPSTNARRDENHSTFGFGVDYTRYSTAYVWSGFGAGKIHVISLHGRRCSCHFTQPGFCQNYRVTGKRYLVCSENTFFPCWNGFLVVDEIFKPPWCQRQSRWIKRYVARSHVLHYWVALLCMNNICADAEASLMWHGIWRFAM